MLRSRLRPLPRSHRTTVPLSSSSSSSAPPPNFQEEGFSDESPEDLFSSFLAHLFPDDAPSFHGDPGQRLLYSSWRYGDLTIMVPSYPSKSDNRSQEIAAGLPRADGNVSQVEEGRKLFAHFLWSAAMVVAEGIEHSDQSLDDVGSEMWKVDGEKVLELGAGAGLPSIISALASASAVTITDHPSSPALSGAIAFNVEHNLRSPSRPTTSCDIAIHPHEWGILDSDPWAIQNKGSYTRIIAADCYWMKSQHENLARTMKWFLAPEGRIWVVAGFHTGRPIVAGFFETAVKMGLEIERIYERDVNTSADSEGGEVRREWVPFREGEGPENRRRWCVIALLRHSSD